MKLRAGTALDVSLMFDETQPALPACRLAMADGAAQLEWSADVIRARLRVSPLAYPPEPGLHGARSRHFEGLHGFLHDSLPEGWGYLLMRKRLAKLGLRLEELSPLDRLALVGRGGRGALAFEPSTTPDGEMGELDLDVLAAEAFAILAGEDSDLADVLARLGGASGGARPKVHVAYDRHGQTVVSHDEAPGLESWIVKFRSPADPIDIGPIEEAYAAMAEAAGLTLSGHRLFPAREGPGYFG
ncbi:MAG: HipA N-terminal domain-containing protein, partial [Ignavibacteriales bacterium]